MATRSRVFQPFRAVGCITNEVPFAVQARGGAHFVTTCTGHSFQIYECAKLGLLFVGPPTAQPITVLANVGDLTLAASGREVLVFERAKLRNTFTGSHEAAVTHLLCFGDLLLSFDEDSRLCTWSLASNELESTFDLGDHMNITAVCHPDTYLNKVLIGTAHGALQLWNIKTQKLIHEFGGFGDRVTCLVPSPATDVIAVGLLDGTVVLYDILHAERIMAVKQERAVTAIAFRTDETPIMATCNAVGDIALWDMERRQLSHLMSGAHDGSVTSLFFFPGEPLLMSASSDNSIKQWLFDSPDGSARLLKSRSGHSKAPTYIRFYGPNGNNILSSGSDRSLRALSILRDAQSVEMSQGSIAKKAKASGRKVEQLKLPLITAFAASEMKEKEWDNIVTCHLQHPTVYTWRFANRTLGQHEIKPQDKTTPKSVCISACGNFTIIGYTSGRCDMFNLQSGAHRRSFKNGHTKAVTGLAVDAMNHYLISCSLDGILLVWDFSDGRVLQKHDFGVALTHLCTLRESDLIAVAADDLTIRVIDIETGKLVRVFRGHASRITDLAFSPDARLLVSAGMDASIRVWDLPTAQLVDLFYVDAIPTSIAFSPKGTFLATAHVDHVGIFLWANRLHFSSVPLVPVQDAVVLGLPTTAGADEDDTTTGEAFFVAHPIDQSKATTTTGDQYLPERQDGLITLSGLPKTRWQNLLNIETIRARNKPIEPPKQPERAPFFLPSLSTTRSQTFVLEPTQQPSKSAILKDKTIGTVESVSNAILRRCSETGDYGPMMEHLLSLGPSATDVAIRSLETVDSTQPYIHQFAEFLVAELETRRNFEMLQTYLQVYLQFHGEYLATHRDAQPLLQRLLSVEEAYARRLTEAFRRSTCLLDIVRNTPM